MPRRMYSYVIAVSALATVLAFLLGQEFPVRHWLPLLALIALNVVTENFAFQLPVAGSVSLSFAVTYAALLSSGPFGAVLCAVAGSYTLQEHRSHKALVISAFNASQLALSAGLAGVTYVSLGGPDLSVLGPWGSGGWLLPALPAAAVFFLCNVVLVGTGLSLLSGHPFLAVLREQGFLSYAASHLVLALLGMVMAALLAADSWLGLLILVLPFMAARRTFRVYAELSEAYTSTVRSLVTAIEAKDPYTKGHSERVAVYARGLADAMHLPRPQVDLIERAALLHDVGKIGIPLNTLTSPAQLSSEEVRLIRQHPDVGSRLVSDVEFLSDIVPVIRHHHERVDGAGYPDGLIGEEIPVLSRMLAVADAYDAMTSTRAYRLAMSTEAAAAELRRVAGLQLDREMAHEFTRLLDQQAFSSDANA